MVWKAWLLLACRAEYLGIIEPETGIAALSVDDLQRDVWMGSQNPDDRSWYQKRMKQMGLKPRKEPFGVCFGPQEAQRISVRYRSGPQGYVALAAQISLAKIALGAQKKLSFCIYESQVESTDWFLGDLQGHDIHLYNNQITTIPNADKNLTTIAEIDYARTRENIKVIAEMLSLF